MKKLLALLLLSPYSLSFGQVSTIDSLPKENLNWYNLSPKNDKIQGVGVDRAYSELLKEKKSKKTIVVAIIDAGVDITHEDLSSLIWVNEDEIAGNRKDDDNNGYVDDINGWNFLGNSEGENINEANLELTRIVRNYSGQFEGKTATDISEIDKVNFDLYSRANNERLEKLCRHAFRKTTLMQFQIRPNNDYRTCRIINTLSKKVLTETTLLSFQTI